MFPNFPRIATLLLLCAAALGSRAEVRLPNIISDHGVFQRGKPIHIWGWSKPGETIAVAFHDQKMSATADAAGHWEVFLKPEAAGGPFVLTVEGSNKLTVSDLLVGDVWVATGQSNMAYGMKGNGVPPKGSTMPHTPELIAAATVPYLRLLHNPDHANEKPQEDQPGKWTLCLPETVPTFSAIGYFFGRDLGKVTKVPVGIIDSPYSGSPIEGWVSKESLEADPKLAPVLAHFPSVEAAHKAAPIRAAGTVNQWHLSVSYNAMINPLKPYAIKGVMWYQGESNSTPDEAPYYGDTLVRMIADWRLHWKEGDFPFLIAQISSYKGNGPRASWGTIRDEQRRAHVASPNTALVVTLDVGDPDDIHPPDKPDVAHRLVLAALGLGYGAKIEYSGPQFKDAKPENGGMLVSFDHAEGLMAKGGELKSFELAGDDAKFVPAKGEIKGSTVFVTSPQIVQPKFVRFGWSNATDANLYNSAGLPAGTFTTGPVQVPDGAASTLPE